MGTLVTSETAADMTRLCAQVQRRLNRRVREFRLTVTDRGLVLSGRSYTYHAKQLAQHATMDMTEMPIALNAITVVPPEFADDGADDAPVVCRAGRDSGRGSSHVS